MGASAWPRNGRLLLGPARRTRRPRLIPAPRLPAPGASPPTLEAIGIGPTKQAFLHACRRNGVDFTRSVTLGRQIVYPSGEFADDLFHQLGATVVDSIDVSDYEDATIVHDLNAPLPAGVGGYSAVVDCGTTEHVFDVATCLRSIAGLCAVDGHVIFATPANNFLGHGFYQFSPDLFFRTFDKGNGFEMKIMLMTQPGRRTLRLADPAQIGERVGPPTSRPAELLVCARKIRERRLASVAQADTGQARLRTDSRAPRVPAVLRPLAARIGTLRAARRTGTPVDIDRLSW